MTLEQHQEEVKELQKLEQQLVELIATIGNEFLRDKFLDWQIQRKKLKEGDVITVLSRMIIDLDNKIQNTNYNNGEHLAWDKDDIRCVKRTLQLFND